MLHIYLSDLPLFMESDILNELFKSKYPVTYEITKKKKTPLSVKFIIISFQFLPLKETHEL